jgi:hypothetical protein
MGIYTRMSDNKEEADVEPLHPTINAITASSNLHRGYALPEKRDQSQDRKANDETCGHCACESGDRTPCDTTSAQNHTW